MPMMPLTKGARAMNAWRAYMGLHTLSLLGRFSSQDEDDSFVCAWTVDRIIEGLNNLGPYEFLGG